MNATVRGVTTTARAKSRRLARAFSRTTQQQPEPVTPGPGRTLVRPVSGMVEQFSTRLVVGWVSVPKNAPPVRITLHLGRVRAAATYASPGSAMSGAGSAARGGGRTAASALGELEHSWQVPNVRGPADDRRNSRREIRTFSFRVGGIWPYVRKKTHIVVRANGRPLPIYGHGMFLLPPKKGKRSLKELEAKLADGYLFSQHGDLQLSKQVDEEWQRRVMGVYQRTRSILSESFGHEAFLIYGTLLGAVREGGYIGHDVDFDAAYVSRSTTDEEAAAELVEIALELVAQGMEVEARAAVLHVHDPDDPSFRIDLFHTFFDDTGALRFPFGVAGRTVVGRKDWQGTQEIDFPGGRALIPVNSEQLVEHLYGDDWRQPKPGFNWALDRTDAADDARLTTQQRSSVYWANFYARTEYVTGSTFHEFVNARSDTPRSVIELGCGDGRDACAFGGSDRSVLGIDQSVVGIEHARAHAEAAKLDHRVSFLAADVADVEGLRTLLSERLDEVAGPTMFYLRFFLHSISQDVQEDMMRVIADVARPGDTFAAEFRTDKDEATTKVHRKHYRRYQNGADFGARLAADYGFTVLHEDEGTGLSPYRGEDPVLYRVVARR